VYLLQPALVYKARMFLLVLCKTALCHFFYSGVEDFLFFFLFKCTLKKAKGLKLRVIYLFYLIVIGNKELFLIK